jgi:hypothetical protein
MANRVTALAPNYPVYDPTPIFGGRLPTIDEIGPPDTRPTALINPSYSVYQGAWGRNLAGLGANEMQDVPTADEGIRDYPNELNVLAAADDIQGNGIFDPEGSHGNVHPDTGIFADHESLPGYIVRDQFYQPSQVIDGTTGEPVMFVPSGAVAIDAAQRAAIEQRRNLWELPPEYNPNPVTGPGFESTVIPPGYAYPVSGIGQENGAAPAPATTGQKMIGLAIVGAAVGLFAATVMRKK